ncbi:precorrin-3B C(17)-methyltransferase [Sulfoacidibacillus thermotolerans]|uniref:Precorrin-3B C(17)-methyltransferase n=1 Tax=Sulfoacidibacillus thermotolerans TaxID=1765684 RepID=A0A2U3DBT1_SULT2|nr:precorrin-3B C(17)-methyltransferase [Sulfoacidibacillus thermotolerans]PWI58736.1 precorrin-3B C(17)-methyltransferase [Sulfoacidibacillus thermotolerans]
MSGSIKVVGFGPGSFEHITDRARQAMVTSHVIIGYHTYVDLIRDLLVDQEIVRTGMTEEVSRAQTAVKLARAGKDVAVISSGDAGVYGMAGLIYEVLIESGWNPSESLQVEIIPGISAINSCASLLGAPIMHDACTISLSDHLTPWETIKRRVEAAAMADFVIALYNPRSGRRTSQIVETQQILLQYRSPDTPVGLVKSAYRAQQHVVRTTLAHMLEQEIGMLTTVIIGNSTTFYHGDLMITPRGYQRKYTLDQVEQRLRPGERLHVENEPWSLRAVQSKENTPVLTKQKASMSATLDSLQLAQEALSRVQMSATSAQQSSTLLGQVNERSQMAVQTAPQQVVDFVVAVAPGVANKRFTAEQLICLADLAKDQGEVHYTADHQIELRIKTEDPQAVVDQLREAGFYVFPVGEVVKVKACDFCDGEKAESIPYARELTNRLGGRKVPKELCIGVNGCAMACYGAVLEDIGIVYRKGKFDLFLGGKTTGRTACAAKLMAEGIPANQIVNLVEQIVNEYSEQAFPSERFHKFFARVGIVAGFSYDKTTAPVVVDTVCGT